MIAAYEHTSVSLCTHRKSPETLLLVLNDVVPGEAYHKWYHTDNNNSESVIQMRRDACNDLPANHAIWNQKTL